MDKSNIIFSKPPVSVPEMEMKAPNYNQILSYDDNNIFCNDHLTIPYEEFPHNYDLNDTVICDLKNGENITTQQLWLDLLSDFSFEKNRKLDEVR